MSDDFEVAFHALRGRLAPPSPSSSSGCPDFELESRSSSSEAGDAIGEAFTQLHPAAAAATAARTRAPNPAASSTLATLWNQAVAPTVGDQLVPQGLGQAEGMHPRQATFERVLRQAWQSALLQATDRVAIRRAQALVWRGFKEGQLQAIEQMKSDLQLNNGADRYLIISRRFDETSMYMFLSKEDSARWYQWLLCSLEADQALTPTDRETITKALSATPRCGYLHTLVQRVFLRWGCTEGMQARVFTPPVAIQRTSASNLKVALRDSNPSLDTEHMVATVAMFLSVFWLVFASDSAASCERYKAETQLAISNYPNVVMVWRYCFAHLCALVTAEVMSKKVLSSLFSIAKLLRFHDYNSSFKSGMAVALKRSHTFIPCSSDHALIMQAASSEACDRIGRLTVMREFHVMAAAHPCSPQPMMMPDSYMQRKADLEDFALYFQLDAGSTCHYCDLKGTRCLCSCQTDAVSRSVASFFQLVDPLMTGGTPAENRWMSTTPWLTLFTLVILVGDIGPQGWLQAWPLEWAHRNVLVNDVEGVSIFTRETSRRLLNASRNWNDVDWKIGLTLVTAVTCPVDRLLRYLQRADGSEHKESRPWPILYELLVTERSPVTVALQEIARLLEIESDLMWLLQYWCRVEARRVGPHNTWAFQTKWWKRLLQMVLSQAAGVYYRMQLTLDSYPMQAFSIPATDFFGGDATAQARRVWNDCPQCHDAACTAKLVKLAACPQDLLPDGIVGKSLAAASIEVAVCNADCERDHSQNRSHFCGGKRALQLDTLCRQAVLHTIGLEHMAAGGRLYV